MYEGTPPPLSDNPQCRQTLPDVPLGTPAQHSEAGKSPTECCFCSSWPSQLGAGNASLSLAGLRRRIEPPQLPLPLWAVVSVLSSTSAPAGSAIVTGNRHTTVAEQLPGWPEFVLFMSHACITRAEEGETVLEPSRCKIQVQTRGSSGCTY